MTLILKLSTRGAAAFTALILAGCAAHGDYHADVTAAQSSIIDHACGGIMGLHPGEVRHRDCVTSLGQSAVYAGSPAMEASFRTARERNACAHIGLTPGTAPFLNCVSNLNATLTAYAGGGER